MDSNIMEKIDSHTNIDQNVKDMTDAITKAAEDSIPNKTVTIRPNDPPWITSHIRLLIRKRKLTYRKFKKSKQNHHWTKYKTLRNTVISELRKSKQEYFEKLDRELSSDDCNSKTFWKTSKQIFNNDKTSTSVPPLKFNNTYAENDYDKAEMLNMYFASQSVIDDSNKTLPIPEPVQHTLESITITTQDVLDVFLHLDVSKACGPDLINPRLLKEGSHILAHPYAVIFNRSLSLGYFPTSWKEANVTPIFKKDDKSQPSNYRPISLLSIVGKAMERCIHKYLYNYITVNDILTPLQSGFRHGDSTTNQLLHTYHTICEAVDKGKEVRAVFCDISKAFDRVWHKGLLFKLRTIGCSDSIINWFLSYLSNRRQRVVINGQASDWASVLAGVPQGSILGPLLFLIFINDIVKHIGCSIRLFADDTSLYIIVDCPLQAGQLLNRDLNAISIWANNWLVTFNPSKTLSMLISRKRNSVYHPPISMDGVIIGEIPSHKHLGLTFSKTCSWDEHIVNISEKAWTRVNLLKALKFRVSRKSLEKMYFAYVRPLLEYSDTVWDNCSLASKKLLDAVHIEAARIVSGGTKLCSVDKLFQELGWEPLQIRRNKHKLVTFYKILHGLTPTYLLDIIPPHINETIDYPLRNADHFQNFRANSNLFHESFFPSTIRAWNNLPNEIKESTSVSAFKVQLNKNLPKPPKYFNVGSRLGQVLQARLRMECSALNADLYRKNIVNSPSCQCGGFENAQHLFFTCPLYAESRRNLSIRLDNYSINQLLYGIEHSTLQENTTLFIEVQNFLTSCGRFNQRREPNQARAH